MNLAALHCGTTEETAGAKNERQGFSWRRSIVACAAARSINTNLDPPAAGEQLSLARQLGNSEEFKMPEEPFHIRASTTADIITLAIDDLMAAAARSEWLALAPELGLELLVQLLTERRPRIMQLIIEDPKVRNSFEIALSKIPATRPRGRGP